MKLCPTCKTQYPEDANFCPLESCATSEGPQRLQTIVARPASRFEPIEKLGGGRTGEVWRARDSQSGVEVAYKAVPANVLSTPAILARAEREFRQLMRVSSPKVATIVDCEKTPAGGLVVAMELWQSDSLERILEAGPVTFAQAKSIVLQVGQALLEAQKAGLVHRDVAPKNILVSASGDVKVINFPLPVPINDKVAGVAAYLSPEQVQGKPVDQRSNTYSLAAILYHLFTGETPFQGATVQAVLDMHVSSPVLPPTQRRPSANLPADVDKLILKGLDKSSSRRHLTLRLFLNELEALKPQTAGAVKTEGGAGLAKTMMFGGNQAEIAKMVAEARAAKAAASGMTPASGVAAAAASAPPPSFGIGHTIAAGRMSPHAATQVQPSPARVPAFAQHVTGLAAHAPTPAPYVKTPAPIPSAPSSVYAVSAPMTATQVQPQAARPAELGKAPAPKSGSAFRETLWFKKGDVEQMVADAKAKQQAAGKVPVESAEVTDDARPLEDRYVDDGSVTVEDRKKFSLRTGGTATAMPTIAPSVVGEKMDERELVGEIGGGRRTLILAIAVVVILALAVVIVMMAKGKGISTSALPAASAAATGTVANRPPTPGGSPEGASGVQKPEGDVTAPHAVANQAAPPGLPPTKAPAPALGTADGTTQPLVGDAARGAKNDANGDEKTGDKPATIPAKKPLLKKKLVVKHAKRKR